MERCSMVRYTCVFVAFGLVTGCSESVKFQPAVFSAREAATHPATVYSLQTGQASLGRATVWSPGIYEEAARTVVDVRVDLQNQTDDPMRFDPSRASLRFTTESNRGRDPERPFRVEGATVVPPKSHVQIRALGALPKGVRPDDVSAFDFDWTVHTSRGDFVDSTAFVQWQPGCCTEPRTLYPVATNAPATSEDPGAPLKVGPR
jgi:hypothetical protein